MDWKKEPNKLQKYTYILNLLVFSPEAICNYGPKYGTEITEHIECMVNFGSMILVHLQHGCEVKYKNGLNGKDIKIHNTGVS